MSGGDRRADADRQGGDRPDDEPQAPVATQRDVLAWSVLGGLLRAPVLLEVQRTLTLQLGPTPEETKAVSNERLNAGALWRAFDRPGIKAQKGKYRCLGAHGMSESLRRRLESIRADRGVREQELFSKGASIVEMAKSDGKIPAEVAAAFTRSCATEAGCHVAGGLPPLLSQVLRPM